MTEFAFTEAERRGAAAYTRARVREGMLLHDAAAEACDALRVPRAAQAALIDEIEATYSTDLRPAAAPMTSPGTGAAADRSEV